ncbi:MAG: hypothetical protein GY832_04175 [Chloroflexi bacterium]|nr:hypothetical protein [Chloroflexota bacterium]
MKARRFWSSGLENRKTKCAQVISQLEHLATTSISLEQLLQQSVDMIVREFELYFVGLYLIDSAQEWVVLRAGTGEAGQRMIERGYRLSLSSGSLIAKAINRKAVCVMGDSPIMGFFYSILPVDMQTESIPPFQFIDRFIFESPNLPETRLEVIFPLRTAHNITGALEICNRFNLPRDSFSLLLPVADKIASVCRVL